VEGLRGWRAWGAGITLLLVLGSCRAIAGLHELTYAASDGACTQVVLPSAGNGRVRLVNAGTQGGSVDFCIRTSGTSDWGQPVLSGGPSSCTSGLEYAQVTVPFAVPAGAIDVETIPAGSSCDALPTSQAMGVTVGDSTQDAPVMTLIRYGGRSTSEAIAALPEEPPNDTTVTHADDSRLRLVNALSSGQALNMGFPQSTSLPTTVTEPLLPQPILPGGVEPPSHVVPGLQSVDAEGYCAVVETGINLGVVFQGQNDAQFTFPVPGGFDVQTVFAIGDSGDSAHPVRGLQCEDAPDAPGATPLLAACGLSDLPSLAVDTFNTALYGADAPFNDERKQAIFDAIAARTSDLMCLMETATDYEAIVQAAQGTFPSSYYVLTDLTTQPTDPADKNGNIPPPPTAPPCAGIAPGILQSIFQCVAPECSSTGDMTGFIATTSCLSGPCAGPLTQLYYQSQADDVCFDCLIYYMNSELPLTVAQTECTSDSKQPFSYMGMNSTLMLSRYPLTNTQAFVLPSTGFRRVVLYAQVELPESVTVDFFCAQLESPLIDGEIPYTGNYGTDIPGQENGWEDEQDLQAHETVAWIKATAKHPAIIAGDWHATAQFPAIVADGGAPVLAPQSVEVMKLLDQNLGGAFVRAEPTGYQPSCESCPAPENVYNTGSDYFSDDFTPTFLLGFDAGSCAADIFWGQANVVPLTAIPYEPVPAPLGPISPYYGRTVRILRPRAPSP
jgi:hypothetical protein